MFAILGLRECRADCELLTHGHIVFILLLLLIYYMRAGLQGTHLLVGTDVTRTNNGVISIPMNSAEVPLPILTLTGTSCS